MCGLVGVIGSTVLSAQERDTFYDMLHFDTLRGKDSTGVAVLSFPLAAKPDVEVYKSVGPAIKFFDEHSKFARNRDLTGKPVFGMVGHNRAATQGAVNVDNAHPFDFANVVGAHNGTVNQASLRGFHGYVDYDVDSQIIFSHLSHTQSIDSVWEHADGALALSWWDKSSKNLNLIRNKERPLFVAYTQDNKTVFWSSEQGFLWLAAARHGVKLRDMINTVPNTLYTFGRNEKGEMCHSERILPPFVAKPVVAHYSQGRKTGLTGYNNWLDDMDDEWGDPIDDKPAAAVKGSALPKILVVREWHESKYNPFATAFTEDGTPVEVIFGASKAKEVKNKLDGRGVGNGYYVAKKIYQSMGYAPRAWVKWEDLAYVHLKKGYSLVRKEGDGFSVPDLPKENYAPTKDSNIVLSFRSWSERTACGCSNCDKRPVWPERNDLYWVDDDTYICKSCQEIPLVQSLIEEHKQEKKESA